MKNYKMTVVTEITVQKRTAVVGFSDGKIHMKAQKIRH
jgi:hypothetical protein